METNLLGIAQAAQQPPPPQRRTVAGNLHFLVFLFITAAWIASAFFATQHIRAASHAPHRAAIYIFGIVQQWLLVAYIAWGVKKHGGTMRELVGGRWYDAVDILRDVGIAFLFWIAALFVLGFASIVLHATQNRARLDFLLPHTALELRLWFLTSITAGICEEIIFRGYLQKQFSAWLGNPVVSIILTSAIFGAGHLYQGWKGAIVIGIYGMLFSILAEQRKSLRPGMMSHAWHDIVVGGLLQVLRKGAAG